MALKNHQYDAVMRSYQRKQLHNKHILDERYEEVYGRIPELADLDRQEASSALSCGEDMIRGDAGAKDRLAEELERIRLRREALLAQAGYDPAYLEPVYDCPLCRDTGRLPDGARCQCFLQEAREVLYSESGHRKQYEAENFSTFDLSFYDDDQPDARTGKTPRETAIEALKTAKAFVEEFPSGGKNLFLYGQTGVGKSFLANCIGGSLTDRLYSVTHYDAPRFFEVLADYQFRAGDSDSAGEAYDDIMDCDLLILDDLGAELTNQFVISGLCRVVDARLLQKKATVITSNLELKDLQAAYLDRTFSRLISGYTFIRLTGKDIRFANKNT